MLDVSPDAGGTLSGARSSGALPLIYSWRPAVDGGAALRFIDNDSTTAALGQFQSADAGRYDVQLTVRDALGRESSPAFATVRVGSAPTVSLVGVAPTDLTPGQQVTLTALGRSTDGRPVVGYTWSQLIGPATPLVVAASSVSFVAPTVSSPTPFSLTVRAVTDLGFMSEVVEVPMTVRPMPDWSVSATASPTTVVSTTDGGVRVRLQAVLSNAPDASFQFAWSPTMGGWCPSMDGGLDSNCSSAVVLSNPNADTTDFFAPRVSSDQSLIFTVEARNLVSNVRRTASATVFVRDAWPPLCTLEVTQLGVRGRCDEPLAGAPLVDAGVPTAPATLTSFGGFFARFVTPQPNPTPLTVEVSGLRDVSGNQSPVMSVAAVTSTNTSPIYRSMDFSLDEPRPGWVLLPSPQVGFDRVRALMGRRITSGAMGGRSAWVMQLQQQNCPSEPCLLSTQTSTPIPGNGLPANGRTVLTVGSKFYVAVSANSLFEGTNATDLTEISTQPSVRLASNRAGASLSLLEFMGTTLQRKTRTSAGFVTNESGFMGPDAVNPVVDLHFLRNGIAVLIEKEAMGGNVKHFDSDAGANWSTPPLTPQYTFGPGVVEVRGAAMGTASASAVFALDSSGALKLYRPESPAASLLVANSVTPGFSVIEYGDGVAVAYVQFGKIFGWVFGPIGPGVQLKANNDTVLSGTSPQVSAPQLELLDEELGLAWQDGLSNSYTMNGRLLR